MSVGGTVGVFSKGVLRGACFLRSRLPVLFLSKNEPQRIPWAELIRPEDNGNGKW